MTIDHLESVLYSQEKDSREKEDLKGFSWKVLHQLEYLLALALNYRKETVVEEDQHVIMTHWKKEGQSWQLLKKIVMLQYLY